MSCVILPLHPAASRRTVKGPEDTHEAADLRGNYCMSMHADAVSSVAFVTDLSAAVTCSVDGKVHFVDLDKRRVLRTFGGHLERAVFAFAYCKR